MKILPLTALALAAALSTPALAQSTDGSTRTIEPYVGVLAGVHDFNNDQYNGGPPSGYKGGVIEGVAGINYNLGKAMIGAEGSVSKGFSGDVDWEYGLAGRLGMHVAKDSLLFAKVGYQWTEFDVPGIQGHAYDGPTYGVGTEIGLSDLGMKASNIALRAQVDTRGDFHSFRPMAGIVAKF